LGVLDLNAIEIYSIVFIISHDKLPKQQMQATKPFCKLIPFTSLARACEVAV
jgi:hypothetical protein